MNKKERLITETFGDGHGQSFARAAAAHARRRHAVRQLSVAAAAAAAAIAVLIAIQRPAIEPQSAAIASAPAYEIISDDELLANLRDQPVLILKDHTGITGVIFLADANSPVGNGDSPAGL